LARVAKALGEARVVTLTGVGGVGRTRLALRAAAEALARFREGAWLVELQSVRDPEAVPIAVAAVFGFTAGAGMNTTESLIEFLRSKQLLLVLDNCEHLLDPAAELVEAVERSCPAMVVLATSREGLALEGEPVVPVSALSAPAADADLATVAESEAVRLFVGRAAWVDPDFALSETNAPAVARVCRRLDGLPLAIELAAARMGTMTPAELAGRLDRRFDILAGGRRGYSAIKLCGRPSIGRISCAAKENGWCWPASRCSPGVAAETPRRRGKRSRLLSLVQSNQPTWSRVCTVRLLYRDCARQG
jgi:predicted ATPase